MNNPNSNATWEEDQEANAFAMALLMPDWMVEEEYNKRFPDGLLPDDKDMQEMADLFQVPLTMMMLRLTHLRLI